MEMMMNKAEKILMEIRRQAFIHADQRCREEENRQDSGYTLGRASLKAPEFLGFQSRFAQ